MAALRKFSQNAKTKLININIHGKIKRAFLLQFLLFFSIFINFPYSAFSQAPDPLLQKLDSHYYYPLQLGLNKLTAKVRWLQKDLAASQPKFISHPDVLFSWNAESDARVFQIEPERKRLSQIQREEVEIFFQNYREIILPRSLNQTLSRFKFNGTKKVSSRIIAEYQSPREQDENQKYILEINSKYRRISKFDIERKTPPYKVASHFKYIQREGKWLVSETLAQFDLERDSYSETTSYTYRKIMRFWLPVKINQTFKKGRDEVYTYRFLLSDYQIN